MSVEAYLGPNPFLYFFLIPLTPNTVTKEIATAHMRHAMTARKLCKGLLISVNLIRFDLIRTYSVIPAEAGTKRF